MKTKRYHLPTVAIMLLLSAMSCIKGYCAMRGDEPVPYTIVLDAGHGGHDLGCRGKTQKEKDITLDVALRTGRLLQERYADSVNVVYTRSTDTFIPLDRRASIANDASADIFVSIHVNSLDKRTPSRHKIHGASVYTVGLHKSDANLAVAMRENAVIELEDDYSVTYQGFDPASSESYIIFELSQDANLNQSISLAGKIRDKLVSDARRADKGVRQAGFLVLWATRMPSVLIELDFICNPRAEDFLASSNGRQQCARAIADGIIAFRNNCIE